MNELSSEPYTISDGASLSTAEGYLWRSVLMIKTDHRASEPTGSMWWSGNAGVLQHRFLGQFNMERSRACPQMTHNIVYRVAWYPWAVWQYTELTHNLTLDKVGRRELCCNEELICGSYTVFYMTSQKEAIGNDYAGSWSSSALRFWKKWATAVFQTQEHFQGSFRGSSPQTFHLRNLGLN